MKIELTCGCRKDTLRAISELKGLLMATVEQFQAALTKIDAATTKIAAEIAELTKQLARKDMTEAQEADVLAALNAAADKLAAIGGDVENPTPEIPV